MTTLREAAEAEEWRSVVGFEGRYEVSDLGVVRSTKSGRPLFRQLVSGRNGSRLRPRVNLSANARRAGFYVSRIVARAFLGECPIGNQVNHIDGDTLNNRIENLEYVTQSENLKHAIRIGIKAQPPHPVGERSSFAKLTADDVRAIFKRTSSGESQRHIAKAYGVSRRLIQFVLNGKSWKHIEGRASWLRERSAKNGGGK